MKFDDELKKGNFIIPECTKCKKIVWPPSDFCSYCLGAINWKNTSKNGKIIEYSKKDHTFFCLAEFEGGIKIMGSLRSKDIPSEGQSVRIEKCSIRNGNYSFEMSTN